MKNLSEMTDRPREMALGRFVARKVHPSEFVRLPHTSPSGASTRFTLQSGACAGASVPGTANTGVEQPAELCDNGQPNHFPYECRSCVRNPFPAVFWDGSAATDPCEVIGTSVDPSAQEPIADPTCPGCGKELISR